MTEAFKALESGYAPVNGLNLYYEIYGEGNHPLVLIHGGGSTIQTSFGYIIPHLAQTRQVIALELQAHGRTNDRNTVLSFEQDADDVAGLLHHLNIAQADFLGFSNGGQTLIEIGIRHPQLPRKLIFASTFYTQNAAPTQFWEGFQKASLEDMPMPLKVGFLAVNDNEQALMNMFKKDVQRMKSFIGWTSEQLRSIHAPSLIISANNDVGSLEHALEMNHILPKSQLAIFPGGHGTYLGTIESLNKGRWPKFNAVHLIEEFLDH
jgi:pimeloyl-ACP methyl ester carboxylesterase